jgi:hypothetical protein
MNEPCKKVIVFDLDETLGYFSQLSAIWDILLQYTNINDIEPVFFELLDAYPVFLRPNIIGILNFLVEQKNKNKFQKIFIYTNNSGPPSWTNFIKSYLESKTNSPIFDDCIYGYNFESEDNIRSTPEKCITDFKKITNLPSECRVCFIDDRVHDNMNNPDVYYIKTKPYVYKLNLDQLIEQFVTSNISHRFEKQHLSIFLPMLYNILKNENFQETHCTDTINNVESNKILLQLIEFIKLPNN